MSEYVPEQVPQNTLNDIPADKDIDVSVANVAISNGSAEGVDETHATNDETGSSKTLGTNVGIKSLSRNDTLKRSVGETVDDLEEEVSRQSTLCERLLCDFSIFGLLSIDDGSEARVAGKGNSAD